MRFSLRGSASGWKSRSTPVQLILLVFFCAQSNALVETGCGSTRLVGETSADSGFVVVGGVVTITISAIVSTRGGAAFQRGRIGALIFVISSLHLVCLALMRTVHGRRPITFCRFSMLAVAAGGGAAVLTKAACNSGAVFLIIASIVASETS